MDIQYESCTADTQSGSCTEGGPCTVDTHVTHVQWIHLVANLEWIHSVVHVEWIHCGVHVPWMHSVVH